jgi:hypothetical protein
MDKKRIGGNKMKCYFKQKKNCPIDAKYMPNGSMCLACTMREMADQIAGAMMKQVDLQSGQFYQSKDKKDDNRMEIS